MNFPDSFEEFKALITKSDDSLKALHDLLKVVGATIVTAPSTSTPPKAEDTPAPTPAPTETPADPAEPTPAPVETPAPAPELKVVYEADLNNFNSADWNKGWWKKDNPNFSIPATDANISAFTEGRKVRLANGDTRTIKQQQKVGNNLSIWLDGPGPIDGDTVGYPNKVGVLGDGTESITKDSAAPTQSAPITPAPAPVQSGDPRQLDFDLPLIGVNIAGAEFGGSFPGVEGTNYIYPGADHFNRYYNEGFRLFRYPFKWERIQRQLGGELYEAEMKKIDAFIAAAEAKGCFVILDMHNYMRYYFGSTGYIIDQSGGKVTTAHFVDVWRRIARRYKGRKAVFAHGLMNEPYPLQPTWPRIAQAAYDAIQAEDPGHWVTVGGTMWSNAHGWESKNPGFPLNGNRIIYEAHCYVDSDASGLFKNRSENIPAQVGVQRQNDFYNWCKKHKVPGFIGEYAAADYVASSQTAMTNQCQDSVKQKVITTYWAGGPWWTASAANGLESGGKWRSTMDTLRKLVKDNPTTRFLGPV